MIMILFIPMMAEELFMYYVSYIFNCWKFQGSSGNSWKLLFSVIVGGSTASGTVFFPKMYLQSLPMHSYSFFFRSLRSTVLKIHLEAYDLSCSELLTVTTRRQSSTSLGLAGFTSFHSAPMVLWTQSDSLKKPFRHPCTMHTSRVS